MRMLLIQTNPSRLPENLPCQPVHQRPLQARRLQLQPLLRLHPYNEIKRHECAFVSVLWEYDEARPGVKIF